MGFGLVFSLTSSTLRGGQDDNWSRFRGPNGSGSVEATGLPVAFGPEQNLVWQTSLPPGHSSPVLSSDRVYVTGVDREALVTIALDPASGRILWQRELTKRHTLPVDKRNDPASPTPAADDGNVYVFFQDSGLASFDKDGRQRWSVPLGPFDNAYGMGSSPVVADGLVILVCDQTTGSFMIAVDKNTGAVRWKVDRPEAKSGHSTPIVYRPAHAGAQLLIPGSFSMIAYALETGEKLWWVNGLAFEMKATPVIHDGLVYIHGTSSASFEDSYGGRIPPFAELRAAHDTDRDGRFSPAEIPDVLAKRWLTLMDLDRDGHLGPSEWAYYQAARSSKGGMWAFRPGGRGDMTPSSVVWHYNRSVPQLPSPLVYGGVLYMVNDGGIMTALDPKTGHVLAQSRLRGGADSYYASPVAADGKIVVVGESGTAIVLKGDASLTVLAANDLNDRVYATPAIANGRLYIRTRGTLFCFGLPRQSN
jgi:outer membrane protein assembly factor BamB